MVQDTFLIEREETFRIGARRRAGAGSWREWKDDEESSLVSQWDIEWDKSVCCGIGGNGKLGSFGGGMRKLSYASHYMNERSIE